MGIGVMDLVAGKTSGAGGGGGVGGGYMQGIAAIGNALNDTHGNVQNTLEWFEGLKNGRGAREEEAKIRNLELQNEEVDYQKKRRRKIMNMIMGGGR